MSHAGHHHAGHSHGPANFDQAFAWGIALNLGFVGVEAFYGWKVDSLALLADAGHNLSDVAGLVLAWGGALAGRIRPDARHTYGFKRASILAAFANALILLVALGGLLWEAAGRLWSTDAHVLAQGQTMMVVAGLGIVINTATALLFMKGQANDLNVRGAFLHMAADALVSAGVVLAGALSWWLQWPWLDPVVSLLIGLVILLSTWGLFRQSLHLLFDGVPDHIDLDAVRALLQSQTGVTEITDLHVWAMGSSQVALTAHLVMPQGHPEAGFVQQLSAQLHDRFDITHATVQVTQGPVHIHCG